MKALKTLIAYIEDCVLALLQKRCDHPGNMVAVDILEGCADGIQVKYCRRCGSIQTLWEPFHAGKPSRFASIPHYWRRPDPHLWRDPVSYRQAARAAFVRSMSWIVALFASAALLLGLSACQAPTKKDIASAAVTTAATITPAVLPPAQVERIASTCRSAQPALAVAAAPGMPAQLRNTAVYPAAYCDQLLASGQLPPTTDANTPSWLPTVLTATQVAAAAAKVALPLIIGAL